MPIRHSKANGRFLPRDAPLGNSSTHTSSGVTGTFKRYTKASTADQRRGDSNTGRRVNRLAADGKLPLVEGDVIRAKNKVTRLEARPASPAQAKALARAKKDAAEIDRRVKTTTKGPTEQFKAHQKQVASKPIAGTPLKNTQKNREKLARTNTSSGLRQALAGTDAALAANDKAMKASQARRAENSRKIARIQYKLKNGLAGASEATVDAHMAANASKGKKFRAKK